MSHLVRPMSVNGRNGKIAVYSGRPDQSYMNADGAIHLNGFHAAGATSVSTDELMPVVYDQLRSIAAGYLSRDSADQLLEPSVLVHETYLRLIANPPASWTSTEHFLAVAASAMRKVLIDHARRRRALKRGFGRSRVSLDLVSKEGSREVDIRVLDDALNRLATVDEQGSRIIELRFFAGLKHDQVAAVLGVSRKTVVAGWTRARAWLADALSDEVHHARDDGRLGQLNGLGRFEQHDPGRARRGDTLDDVIAGRVEYPLLTRAAFTLDDEDDAESVAVVAPLTCP